MKASARGPPPLSKGERGREGDEENGKMERGNKGKNGVREQREKWSQGTKGKMERGNKGKNGVREQRKK